MSKVITWYCCDWWTHHSFALGEWEQCNCYRHYGSVLRMKDWLEMKWYKVLYPHDITPSMRDQYMLESPPPKEMQFLHADHSLSTSEVAQRNAWTIARLQCTSTEELVELKNKVIEMYPMAYQKWRLRPKVLKALTMILLRRRYNCPHP